jgi:hypothetical protein
LTCRARQAGRVSTHSLPTFHTHCRSRTVPSDVVLASLSLHYFPWRTTVGLFAEIHRVLRGASLLLLRVNATDDVEHGAGIGEEIEPNYFRSEGTDGRYRQKRFFDERAVRDALGARFVIRHLRHDTTDRYGTTKRVWECLAARATCV